MKCYILRHAQTNANSKGMLSCDAREPLNDVGRLQSKRLARVLSVRSFSRIWTSPFLRAMDTILPYCELVNAQCEAKAFLSEGRFNLNPNIPPQTPFYTDEGIPPNDEPIECFRGRVQEFIKTISENDLDSLLVVTHGHFIREFLNMLLGATRYARWPIDNCSETLIEFSDELYVRHVNRKIL